MQVKIQETVTVQPATPPFDHDHVLSLSHLDTDRNLHVTFRYLRVYASNDENSAEPFSVITTALSTALIQYYPLTGTLRGREIDGRLELYCQLGKGAPVIRAAVGCSLSSLNYLSDLDEEFVEQLVPDPDLEEGITRPMILQVTGFACGGFILGAAIHHSLCDGLGASLFFNGMAELARGAGHITVESVWDRVKFLGPRNPARIEFPIHDFLSLDKELSPYLDSGKRVIKECFDVKEEWLDRLKAVLLKNSGLKFTTFEALGAFIWRARVKFSNISGDEKVSFTYSINIRKLVKPPLPVGYWGNGCAPMYVHLTARELVEQPIWETADLIKKSKYNATDEYVRSYIDFQELNYEKGITAGQRVSGFTDWRHLGHSTVDFGWGGPVTVLPLSRHLLGSVEPSFFLPCSSTSEGKKDGFKVLVHLQEGALQGFREEMNKLKNLDLEHALTN